MSAIEDTEVTVVDLIGRILEKIFGELEHGWERFKINTNYRSFIIKLKDEDN